jgi:hypothetical protein
MAYNLGFKNYGSLYTSIQQKSHIIEVIQFKMYVCYTI